MRPFARRVAAYVRSMGSNPILSFRQGSSKRRQLVDASKRSACAERLADNQEVGGSNPSLVVRLNW